MQLYGNIYPSSWVGKRYIYFSSLLHKNPPANRVVKDANQYLYGNRNLKKPDPKQSLATLENTLYFLETIINSEKEKETSFINFLLSKKEIPEEIKRAAINGSWSDFTNLVNEALQGQEMALKQLQSERLRLITNQERSKEIKERTDYNKEDIEKALQGYTRSVNKRITEDLKKISDFLFKGKRTRTSDTVVKYIIENFGAEIFTFNGKSIQLDTSEVAALILGISQLLFEEYETILINNTLSTQNKKENMKYGKDIRTRFRNVLNENKEKNIVADVKKMLSDLNRKHFFSESVKENFSISPAIINHFYTAKQKQKKNNNYELDTSTIFKEITEIFSGDSWKKQNIGRNAITLIADKNAISEIRDTTIHLINGALFSHRIGQSKSKTDVFAGYLNVDLNTINSYPNKLLQNQIKKIQQKIEHFSHTFKQTNDLTYMKQRDKEWQKLVKQIDQIIKDIQISLGILTNCYLIESSDKSYESIFSESGKIKYHEFHGGSLGSNIIDQIEKIHELGKAGGLILGDIEWLISSVLNSNFNMLGAGNKTLLEQYFSAISAILLFDNSLGIVNDAFKGTNTTTQQIHLFYLNNNYFPLSTVLTLVKNELNKIYHSINADLTDMVYAQITGYVNHPPKFDPKNNPMTVKSWEDISKKAQKSANIKITFFAGFLDILEKLSSPFSLI